MVVEVLHPSRPNVPKAELEGKLASIYKTDKERVITFGFRTQFGGGRSTGFALIYDDLESQKKFEPRYRLVRVRATPPISLLRFSLFRIQSGLATKVDKASRKLRKERKNRAKKVRAFLFALPSYISPNHSSSVAPKRPRLLKHPRKSSRPRLTHVIMHHARTYAIAIAFLFFFGVSL